MLSESKGVLSKDRLSRVQGVDHSKKSSRRLKFEPVILNEKTLKKKEELQVGDWCMFHAKDDVEKNSNNEKKTFLGNVLSFQYIGGKTAKEKEFTWDFAPVSPPANIDINKGVQVLASWYKINSKVELEKIAGVNNFYINIEAYIATFSHQPLTPDFKNIDKEFVEIIKCDQNYNHLFSFE